MGINPESVCPEIDRVGSIFATVVGRYRLGVGVIRGVRLPDARSLRGTWTGCFNGFVR